MRQVVKLGGSLHDKLRLRDWLHAIARRGRIAIVPGGGAFADAARAAQARWQVDDVAAHNMAVLGMAQSAQLMNALCPELACGADVAAVRAVLDQGGSALWMPLDLLRTAPDALTNWDTTSDSLALHLADALPASEVLLVKSCAIPQSLAQSRDFAALAAAGIVDRRFPQAAAACAARVRLCMVDEVDRWASMAASRR